MLNTELTKNTKSVSSDDMRITLYDYIMTYYDDIKTSLSHHLRAKNLYLGLGESSVNITTRPSGNYGIVIIKLTNPCVKDPDKYVIKQLVNQYIEAIDDNKLLCIMKYFAANNTNLNISRQFVLWFCDNFTNLPTVSDIFIKDAIAGYTGLFLHYWLCNEVILSSFTTKQLLDMIDILDCLLECDYDKHHIAELEVIIQSLNKIIINFNNFDTASYLKLCYKLGISNIKLNATIKTLIYYTKYPIKSAKFVLDQKDITTFCDEMFSNPDLYQDITYTVNELSDNNCVFILNNVKSTLIAWNKYLKQAPTHSDKILEYQEFINFILQHTI